MRLDKQCSLIHLFSIAHSMAPMTKRRALIGRWTPGNLFVCDEDLDAFLISCCHIFLCDVSYVANCFITNLFVCSIQ